MVELTKKDILRKLISCIDLTTLSNKDNQDSVQELIDKANQGHDGIHPAAVCTFSNLGHFVKGQLNPSIKAAVVGSSFPTSQTLSSAKIAEAKLIAETGIDELDIVINRGDAIAGNFSTISNEINEIRAAIGTLHLKVILETGELQDERLIKKTAQIAIDAGADFIKTSTGKTEIGATTAAVGWMCEIIHNHYTKTGIKIGIKPSGGIRSFEDAILYFNLVGEILGAEWQNPQLFRIGASSLYDTLIEAYQKC